MHLKRNTRKKTHILALGLIMFALLLPGCIGQEEEEVALATDPDTLVIVNDISDSVSLDPAQAYEFSSCYIVRTTYDCLVALNPDDYSVIEPRLAESWSKSADGITWTFNIRQDANFHSGRQVTADDVVWSLQRLFYLDMAPDFVILQWIESKDDIKKVGDFAVEITFTDKYADFLILSCLAFTVGSVIDRELALEHEEKTDAYPDGDMGNLWLNDHSAGSGPFILDHWTKLDEFVLNRYEDWYINKAGMKKVIMKHIPDYTVERMQLEAGDADIAMQLQADQIKELKGEPGIRIQTVPSFRVRYVAINQYNFEPGRDERVRDAIRWAIDYQGIVNEVMAGGAIIGQSFVPNGMFGHNPAMPYTRDVAKAKALLEDAGYSTGFEAEMLCSNAPPWPAMAVKIQADLAEVGIDVTVTQMVSAEMYQVYRQQNHEMILAQWGADYPDPDAQAKPFAHCDDMGPDGTVHQLAWRNMAENPELADMVDAAALEPDEATRIAMYIEMQEIVADWGPFAILYYPLFQHGVRTWVEGYTLGPMFFGGELWTVYKERVAA
ncbi:MAG: ABC transporter substrate-binding protein [Candidatus Heimdallarchaeota archaeon]